MAGNIQLPDKLAPLDGEQVLNRWWANRTVAPRRAIGGRLYLTNRRVLFNPHMVDAALNAEPWWAPFEAIHAIARQKKNFREPYAGLRDRLRIDLSDGSAELFVINRLNKVIDQIKAAATTV